MGKLYDIGLGDNFLDMTPKTDNNNNKKINCTSSKFKTCASKDT